LVSDSRDDRAPQAARAQDLAHRGRKLATGQNTWGGTYLVNPWEQSGALVDLDLYPRLAEYFNRHGRVLRNRHVAGKAADKWYRTIDKVDHTLVDRPKLLFPDLKMTTHPVLEPGGLYPHHNLYYVVSDKWDLRVLGGLLLSKVAEAFVAAYCVKMRGGTLRFQAQSLRRIRVPSPDTLTATDQAELASAFDRRDAVAATEIAIRLYGLEEHAGIIRGA
jgi:adenine-specific DNA-methyltransferase